MFVPAFWGVTVKKVNNMHLQNVVMQLRKVCLHHFLFDWPLDPQSQQPVMDEQLVDVSGEMMVLERLLEALLNKDTRCSCSRSLSPCSM